MYPAPSSPAWFDSTSSPCDKDTFSVDSFMRYFNNQPHNFHLVGAPSHSSHVNISIPETNGGSSPSEVEVLSDQPPAVLNNEKEQVRTDKRILWTQDEDERLMSAWIEKSTDSANGADRKGEAYWGDVIEEYNKNTPSQRKRNAKQAKDRWHKINKWCDLFECAYLKARRVFTSGYSDQMWMDAADKFYVEDNKNEKLAPFMLKNVWKICREEPKWKTYNLEMKNARKRKSYHLEEDREQAESEEEMPERPPGQKAAKRDALAAKGKPKVDKLKKSALDDKRLDKSKESALDDKKLDKLNKIQEINANRMKQLELQQKLSSERIENTRIAHLTAQENREAKKLEMEGKKLEMEGKKLEMEQRKLEMEAKKVEMKLEAYNNLITQDTTSMIDEEKAERVAAMKCLRKMLFPEII